VKYSECIPRSVHIRTPVSEICLDASAIRMRGLWTIFVAPWFSRVLKSMKPAAYRLPRYPNDRAAPLVMSSFFSIASSFHAPIGRHPILPCHGKIKRAFNAASHLGDSSAIAGRQSIPGRYQNWGNQLVAKEHSARQKKNTFFAVAIFESRFYKIRNQIEVMHKVSRCFSNVASIVINCF